MKIKIKDLIFLFSLFFLVQKQTSQRMEKCDLCGSKSVIFGSIHVYSPGIMSRCREHIPHPHDRALGYIGQQRSKMKKIWIDCCEAILQEAKTVPDIWKKCSTDRSDSDLLSIIQNVVDKKYSDFESEYACPKITFVDHLQSIGLVGVARDVMNGKYDDDDNDN